jgi:FlaA1/EpsC-like NDP-sugar epimerase
VLVTGEGGLIGSQLCEDLLEVGAGVTAMLDYSSLCDWDNLEFM